MVIEVYKRATSADWATARLTSRKTTQGTRLTDWRTGWHAPLPRVIDPLGAAFLLAFSHEKLTPTTGTENSQQQQEQFETRNGLGAWGMHLGTRPEVFYLRVAAAAAAAHRQLCLHYLWVQHLLLLLQLQLFRRSVRRRRYRCAGHSVSVSREFSA